RAQRFNRLLLAFAGVVVPGDDKAGEVAALSAKMDRQALNRRILVERPICAALNDCAEHTDAAIRRFQRVLRPAGYTSERPIVMQSTVNAIWSRLFPPESEIRQTVTIIRRDRQRAAC